MTRAGNRTGNRTGKFAVSVMMAALGVVVAGCSDEVTGGNGQADGVELSEALAYRDGDPVVTIVSPADGAVVSSPFWVEVDTANLNLRPSGETRDGEGHLHIFVNQDCLPTGSVIPVDSSTIHIGTGKNRHKLNLQPGRHELCIQIGDGFHIAVAVSNRVSVLVEGSNSQDQ